MNRAIKKRYADPISFGILGLGMIAEFHVRAIQELTGCRFVAGKKDIKTNDYDKQKSKFQQT